jgi:hypothetical protein|tara:strand:+ start:455 stop:652 length:198 start_codon:yes stop_codon:yes gene_type:complete
MLEALKKRYEAQIAESKVTLKIYLSNSVGIGEHPQHLDEIDKLLNKIAEAEDKLKVIENVRQISL